MTNDRWAKVLTKWTAREKQTKKLEDDEEEEDREKTEKRTTLQVN